MKILPTLNLCVKKDGYSDEVLSLREIGEYFPLNELLRLKIWVTVVEKI